MGKTGQIILFIVLIIALIWTNIIVKDQQNYIKTLKDADSARTFQLEVEKRRIERAAEDKLFNYRDSIRQSAINNLLITGKISNAKAKQAIENLKDAPDSHKDSLWIDEWNKKDESLFD